MKRIKALLLSFVLLFSSCSLNNEEKVKVILEDGDYKCINNNITLPKGSDFTFDLTLDINKVVSDASYKNYTIEEELLSTSRKNKITFHHVDYSTIITLSIMDAVKINYRSEEKEKEEYVIKTHERINTSKDYNYFSKDGYIITGWKNNEDIISLGSRVTVNENTTLEAHYVKESDVSLFQYEELDEARVSIKKYLGNEKVVVVPEKINDKNVISISNNAFSNLDVNELILPRTLSSVSINAFNNVNINNLVFFDNITDISDESFVNSQIEKIRINAVSDPAYIRNYFGTYPEKVDRLLSIKDKNKIILYSGSSTRFGFDSELIDKSFLDYEVVNMGVFAYTASYPQVDVISRYIKEGDKVIVSPEFDAIDEQINLRAIIDSSFIAMCESNYDILSLLDLSKYERFFSSFKEYQYNRSHLKRYNYLDSSYQYDEDGNKTTSPSYNRYGDYVVYRKNNEERKSYGVKRAFYNKKYFLDEYIVRFNKAYKMLEDKQAILYYDYSPRMNVSISPDSSEETIKELGEYLENNINMIFISSIYDSLMDPLYFYGTDNHLSTEGVSLRTKRVISSLFDRMNV